MKVKATTRLRHLLKSGKTLVKPGAHNSLAARIPPATCTHLSALPK